MTTYTLVIIWFLGTKVGQNITVAGFSSVEHCQHASETIMREVRHRGASFCLEIAR